PLRPPPKPQLSLSSHSTSPFSQASYGSENPSPNSNLFSKPFTPNTVPSSLSESVLDLLFSSPTILSLTTLSFITRQSSPTALKHFPPESSCPTTSTISVPLLMVPRGEPSAVTWPPRCSIRRKSNLSQKSGTGSLTLSSTVSKRLWSLNPLWLFPTFIMQCSVYLFLCVLVKELAMKKIMKLNAYKGRFC
ncbi:hypothetical protein RYX36_003087, partial [Vicia faba]